MSICKQCGATSEADARFCAQCGAPLEAFTDAPPAAEAPVEPQSTEIPAPPSPEPQAPVSLEKSEPSPSEEPYDLVENGWPEAWPAEQPPKDQEYDLVRDGWPKPWSDEPTVTAPNGDEPVKRPLSFKITVAVVALLGLVAVGSVLAVLVTLFSSGGKDAWSTPVFQSLVDTSSAISAELAQASEEIGLAPILTELEQKGLTQDLMISASIEDMGSASIHIFQATNAALDSAYTTFDMGMLGMNLSLLRASYDKGYLSLASPLLFSGVYGVSLTDFKDQFARSDLGALLGTDDAETAAFLSNYLEAYSDMLSQITDKEGYLSKSTKTALLKATATLEDAMVCTDPVETRVSVNGNDVLCMQTVASISPESLETYLNSCIDILLEDPFIDAYMRTMMAADPEYVAEMLDETLGNLRETIQYFCGDMDEIVLTVYLQDGIALRTELLFVLPEEESFAFILELGGGRNQHLTDAVTLSGYENDEAIFQIAHGGNIIPQNGIVKSTLVITYFDAYAEEYFSSFELFMSWDTTQSEDNYEAYFSIADDISLGLSGSIRLENGIFVDPMEFYVYTSYGDEYSVPVFWSVTPTTEVQSLKDKAKDLLEMSEEELLRLSEEIESASNRFFGY